MNAPARLEAQAALHPSWPLRWEASKGTERETACLLSIAAEAGAPGPHRDAELATAAYDAATCPADDRPGFIAEVERIFIEYAAAEQQEWTEEDDLVPLDHPSMRAAVDSYFAVVNRGHRAFERSYRK